jgi:hypothetical protein
MTGMTGGRLDGEHLGYGSKIGRRLLGDGRKIGKGATS